MEKSHVMPQIITTVLASITLLTAGFHIGWVSPTFAKLQAPDSDLPVTSDQGAWIITSSVLTGLIGALGVGSVVNRWGRKRTLLLSAIPFILGFILVIAARNHWWLLFSRIISGIGIGMALSIIPMYMGEIASNQVRGALGILSNSMTNMGILLAYCVGPWVSRDALAGVGCSLPIIFVLTFYWMPESPYFLVMNKDLPGAEKSLVWLRGTNDVKEELKEIEESIGTDETGTFKDLISTQGNRKALLIITILMMAPQMSGISAILSYTSLIFEASGSKINSSISVIIIGAVQWLSCLLSSFTVDSLGRRPLLLLSICGSVIFLGAEALYFHLQTAGTDVSSISWLPVTAMVGYMIFYAIGLSSLPYIILSEIFPCNVKALATMYAIFTVAISSLMVIKLYQVISDSYGVHISFYCFTACSATTGLILFFILPETKRKSLREIQDLLVNSTYSRVATNPSNTWP